MAKYIVTYQFAPENRNEAIERFLEGSALEDSEGTNTVGRWHAVGGNRGWVLVEANDPSGIADNLLNWTDLIRYEVTPVIEDEQLGELLVQHGHG